MADQKYDTVVIGSGPGGEGAAMTLAKGGHKVAMIEKHSEIGGACTHWGTIPSKALRHVVKRAMEYNSSALYNESGNSHIPSFPQALKTAANVISQQVGLRTSFYNRNRISLYSGHAKFIDKNTISVASEHGEETIYAENFVIATGSRPYQPDDVNFDNTHVFDSDTILGLGHTPRSITIYGAGVIGSEYASIFRGLGVKVDLINTRSRLLSFLDDEISDALSYYLREEGVLIRHNENYEKVERDSDGVVLHLESGKKIRSEILLWANGRTGNSQNMGLEEALDIQPDSRGQLKINENFQTTQPHVYAVGDIVGWPSLASASYDQGRLAASHILNGACEYRLVEDVPTGIYTIPEISSVGKTEAELTEARVPYEVGHSFFKNLARAQISGQTVGMLKILFHRETYEILGIHCFGDQASEIIHIGQAIMAQKGEGNNLMYFISTTFNYPTMAEAYRVAALNGLNRVC